MRIVRVKTPLGEAYATLVDDEVELVDGWPSAVSRRGERFGLHDVELLAPVLPSKIVAVGRNYLPHIVEMGYERPDEPSIFLKPPSAVIGSGGQVVLPHPSVSAEVEHEAELALVIGQRARHLTTATARDVIAGYTCANDVSARDLQRRDRSLARAKGFDTFCPIGPWIETAIDLDAGVGVRCHVNGELRQVGHTNELLFDVDILLVAITQVMTLEPGDVVLTGSPGGTGRLQPGDEVAVEIDGIGTLVHGVRATDT